MKTNQRRKCTLHSFKLQKNRKDELRIVAQFADADGELQEWKFTPKETEEILLELHRRTTVERN